MPRMAQVNVSRGGNFGPADHNYLAWSYDIAVAATGTIIPAGGTLNLVKLKLDTAATVTNIVIHLTNAGVTLTSGQNFGALYSAAGALLAQTTDQTTAWGTGGLKVMALSSPQAVAAGYCFAGFWAVGSTLPTISRGQVIGANIANPGLSAPNFRFSTADSSLTTTAPASFGTQTSSANTWWVALS